MGLFSHRYDGTFFHPISIFISFCWNFISRIWNAFSEIHSFGIHLFGIHLYWINVKTVYLHFIEFGTHRFKYMNLAKFEYPTGFK